MYRTSCEQLFEQVACQGPAPYHLGARAPQVMIDVIHDGDAIPLEFLVDADGRLIEDDRFIDTYVEERDWGAGLIASHIARNLGLHHWYRLNVARVLMDIGRFPGETEAHAEHLRRFAINYPFSHLLGFTKKKRLLEHYYDAVSYEMDNAVRGRMLKLAVHTYDRNGDDGTVRPAISVITRTDKLRLHFDPLYPKRMGEFTCDRVLRDRLSLTLEKNGLAVAHNHPYLLPEGSIETRAQVWFFFDYLQQRYEEADAESRSDPAFQRVWTMLKDTNLRSSASESLRSFLHMFRRAPLGEEAAFEASHKAYERIKRFIDRNESLVEDFRFSRKRVSTLGIEVRKDLVVDFDPRGRPVGFKEDVAARIGDVVARAIAVYFEEDRERKHVQVR